MLIAAMGVLPLQAQTVAGNDEKDCYDYFTASLKGEELPEPSTYRYDTGQLTAARQRIWSIWKQAVDDFSEEKLIGLDLLENRNSGSWTMPSDLESGTMPYYYGYNGYPTFDKGKSYPLFLYMHGSGDKTQEWETGIGLCLRRFYSHAIYFVPQIPNAYGEYYRWAIQSMQWAWEKLLRLAFLSENVDHNRIYFFGIS